MEKTENFAIQTNGLGMQGQTDLSPGSIPWSLRREISDGYIVRNRRLWCIDPLRVNENASKLGGGVRLEDLLIIGEKEIIGIYPPGWETTQDRLTRGLRLVTGGKAIGLSDGRTVVVRRTFLPEVVSAMGVQGILAFLPLLF